MKDEKLNKKKNRTWILCKCDGCGIEFHKELRHYKRTRTHFCSRDCWCKNGIKDKTMRENLSKSLKGKKYPDRCGENHHNWQPNRNRHCIDCGKKFTNRQESQRCRACFIKHDRGENCPAYIDGRTPVIRSIRDGRLYKDWRHEVYERDNYTCAECGAKRSEGNPVYIEAHHIKHLIKIMANNNIKSYEDAENCKELWDVSNGLTLCLECHKKKHKNRLKIA